MNILVLLGRLSSGGGVDFLVYQFTNKSEDIKNLFVWACSLIGVKVKNTPVKMNIHIYKNSIEIH